MEQQTALQVLEKCRRRMEQIDAIKRTRARLLDNVTDTATHYSQTPGGGRRVDKIPDAIARREDAQSRIDRQLDDVLALVERAGRICDALDNKNDRNFARDYWINALELPDVAKLSGVSISTARRSKRRIEMLLEARGA